MNIFVLIYVIGWIVTLAAFGIYAHVASREEKPTFTDASNAAALVLAISFVWPLLPIGFLLGLLGGWRPWR